MTGTLATIAERIEQADLKPPATVIVGEVVSLREKIDWFEKLPLFGSKIVVTRAADQATEFSDRPYPQAPMLSNYLLLRWNHQRIPHRSIKPLKNWQAMTG